MVVSPHAYSYEAAVTYSTRHFKVLNTSIFLLLTSYSNFFRRTNALEIESNRIF